MNPDQQEREYWQKEKRIREAARKRWAVAKDNLDQPNPDQQERWTICPIHVRPEYHRKGDARCAECGRELIEVMRVTDHEEVLQRLLDAEYPTLFSLERAILKELGRYP